MFQVAAAYPGDVVLDVQGETKAYNGLEQDGVGNAAGLEVTYHFCPTCGSTLYWVIAGDPPLVGMAAGNFVEDDLPAPQREYWVETRHAWVPPFPGAEQFDQAWHP